eukprot:4383081-Prymnesium_polylepis.1
MHSARGTVGFERVERAPVAVRKGGAVKVDVGQRVVLDAVVAKLGLAAVVVAAVQREEERRVAVDGHVEAERTLRRGEGVR